MYTNYNPYSGSTLTHYGVKGMKWGVRRKAYMNDKRDTRRNRAEERARALEKSAPGSSQAIRARVRAQKTKESRYGQTNPRIVGEYFVRSLAGNVVSNLAYGAAAATGRQEVMDMARIASGTYNLANTGNMIYKLSTNYR